MNETKKSPPVSTYIFKGAVMGLFTVIIKLIVSFSSISTYTQNSIIPDLPNFAVCISIFICSIIIYNSIFSLFLFFSPNLCNEYLFSKNKPAFISKSFLAEAIPAITVLSFAAAIGANFEITGIFKFHADELNFSGGFVPFIATIFITSLLLLYQRYESIRYWKFLKRHQTIEELKNKPKIIFKVLLISVAYPIILPFIPLLGYLIFTLIRTLQKLISTPLLCIFLILIIFFIVLIKLIISLNKRKKFIKQVITVAREHSFELSEIQNPYASLFSRKKQCLFTLKSKKAIYDCLVIGHLKREVPICFISESEGYFRLRLGTAKHNITIQKHFVYSTPGNGKKIMIINPTPKYAYICDLGEEQEKRIYNAEKVWDYVAYEAEAFIGALDRGCLGNYSSAVDKNDPKIPKLRQHPIDV